MKKNVDLSCTYMGLKLKSPLIAGSCGLTNSIEKIKKMESYGVGAVVLKSIFEEQIIAEIGRSVKTIESEYMHPDALDYIKNYTETTSYDAYSTLISDLKKEVSIPIIASINCVSDGDWIDYAKRVQEAGADALELNISILPIDFEMTANELESKYFQIIRHVKNKVTIPIAVKVSPYFSSLGKTLKTFSFYGADALVLFNRLHQPDIDIEKMKVIGAGLERKGTEFYNVLRWMSIMSSHLDCDLSATSGVENGKDVVKQLLAGSDTVQIATVMYKKGIEVIKDILSELSEWMEKHEYKSIDDFKGKLNFKNISDPNVYLRIQFMKHFAGIE
ncbi:MAG: dihydroorotate dehydrogenase-like protein [Bacteroidales bacterium]|nr:dihydroorotate dehydrogenase-like protein [Bacteroidales bacterium]